MDEKEILQRQVDALEKLLNIKEAIIAEQEARIQKLESDNNLRSFIGKPIIYPPSYAPWQPQAPINLPTVFGEICPVTGALHEYPIPWLSTSPAPCNKCGKLSSLPSFTIASSNNMKIDDGV